MDGFILINKPVGPTSHDIVSIVRKQLGTKKIGHLGTLDPLAEGLLVLAVGKATKLTQFLLEHNKVYRFGIILGAETPTHDSELPISKIKLRFNINPEIIEKTIFSFLGKNYQKPPLYSAIKIKGTKLCNIARQNKYKNELDEDLLPAREIFIYDIAIEKLSIPYIQIKAKVSSGTYIRSLARDIGRSLGCGAFVCLLKRISVGDFNIKDAVNFKNERITADNIISIDKAINNFLKLHINSELEKRVMNGISFSKADYQNIIDENALMKNGNNPIIIFSEKNEPLCISVFDGEKILIRRGLF